MQKLSKLSKNKKTFLEYEVLKPSTWCSGCGNYAIFNALKHALTLENIKRKDAVFCFDIGCVGNGSDKINAYTVHGLHGRVLPLATGVKLADKRLKVFAHAGDGATLNEGLNHLIHAARNNFPIIFIHHNNGNFALTTGQASAASKESQIFNSSPNGVVSPPINPVKLMLTTFPRFVARSFSGDLNHMTQIFQEAINYNGFAFIDIIQSCPTYNKSLNTENILPKLKYVSFPSPKDINDAISHADTDDGNIYLGIFHKPSSENYIQKHPILKKNKAKTKIDILKFL